MMFSRTVNKTPAPAECTPARQPDSNSASTSNAQPKTERRKVRRRPTSTTLSGSVPSSSHSSRSSHRRRDNFESSHAKANVGETIASTSSQHTRPNSPPKTPRSDVNINFDFHIGEQPTKIPEPTTIPESSANPESTAPQENRHTPSNCLPNWHYLDNDYFTMQYKSETQWKYYIAEKQRLYEYDNAKAILDNYHQTTLSAINSDSSNGSNIDGILSTLSHSRNLYIAQKKRDAQANLENMLKDTGASSSKPKQ